jgi:hypothetical protein
METLCKKLGFVDLQNAHCNFVLLLLLYSSKIILLMNKNTSSCLVNFCVLDFDVDRKALKITSYKN